MKDILQRELGMKKSSRRSVPHFLSEAHKAARVEASKSDSNPDESQCHVRWDSKFCVRCDIRVGLPIKFKEDFNVAQKSDCERFDKLSFSRDYRAVKALDGLCVRQRPCGSVGEVREKEGQ
jgi:hypothetical protein